MVGGRTWAKRRAGSGREASGEHAPSTTQSGQRPFKSSSVGPHPATLAYLPRGEDESSEALEQTEDINRSKTSPTGLWRALGHSLSEAAAAAANPPDASPPPDGDADATVSANTINVWNCGPGSLSLTELSAGYMYDL